MSDRRQLAAQLVRAQAMLWSAEDPATKARIRGAIQEIERRLLALDDRPPAPRVAHTSMVRLGK